MNTSILNSIAIILVVLSVILNSFSDKNLENRVEGLEKLVVPVTIENGMIKYLLLGTTTVWFYK